MTRKSSGGDALVARRRQFRKSLLVWYRSNRRRLPWRESPSPYGTVVSEFMLQQTQVSTVLPYFERWMAAFPDFSSLARASEAAVLRLWEGLGYYSRARNLHRLAKAVAPPHSLPRTAAALAELPGIGPYTAAAVASIAFDEVVACVDGNVVRILSRLARDPSAFADSASASRVFAPLAGELANPSDPGDHNQAMMELGATICTKRHPVCPRCPVRVFCASAAAGDAETYPRLAKKVTERISVVRLWIERDGSVLLHLSPAGARRLAGLHELPTAEQAGLDPRLVDQGSLIGTQSRGITRFRIDERLYRVDAAPAEHALIWIPLEKLESVALSGPHRRWMRKILSERMNRA